MLDDFAPEKIGRPSFDNNPSREIEAELDDVFFARKTHYYRSTYAAGCRGPLCRQGARDWYRHRQYLDRKEIDPEAKIDPPATEDERNLIWLIGHILAVQYVELPPCLLVQIEALGFQVPKMAVSQGWVTLSLAIAIADPINQQAEGELLDETWVALQLYEDPEWMEKACSDWPERWEREMKRMDESDTELVS